MEFKHKSVSFGHRFTHKSVQMRHSYLGSPYKTRKKSQDIQIWYKDLKRNFTDFMGNNSDINQDWKYKLTGVYY